MKNICVASWNLKNPYLRIIYGEFKMYKKCITTLPPRDGRIVRIELLNIYQAFFFIDSSISDFRSSEHLLS